MGRTSITAVTKNGLNEVFFRPTAEGSSAAVTYSWADGSGHLTEADVVVYDGGFTFFPASATCSGGVYLLDIVTHEFGHVLGIAHSNLTGTTMTSGTGYCWTSKRWLAEDDKQAIEALYPPRSSNAAPVVSVVTPMSNTSLAEGTPINFTGSAIDAEDGDIGSTLIWISNRDGQLGTGPSVQRALTVGTHTITTRATDSAGAASEVQRNVTVVAVTAAAPTGFTLSGTGYKVKGLQRVDLAWLGATSTRVDVYRNGARVNTVPNSGPYTDMINKKGSGTYVYVACESGTQNCTNAVRIAF
jgi:hypothetical protein